jgi:hypothetical protein
MATFAKLKRPLFGMGKAHVEFSKEYYRLKPSDQMAVLNGVMRDLRRAYDEAERNHRIARSNEDARNANKIRRVS